MFACRCTVKVADERIISNELILLQDERRENLAAGVCLGILMFTRENDGKFIRVSLAFDAQLPCQRNYVTVVFFSISSVKCFFFVATFCFLPSYISYIYKQNGRTNKIWRRFYPFTKMTFSAMFLPSFV